MMNEKINIFNIQRFSLYDGPGIRTTVFLKGCTLNCKWCHNPESISKEKQIQFIKSKCIGCNACKKVCPNFEDYDLPILKNSPIINHQCISCLKCVENCPSKALEIIGHDYEIEQLVNIILRDIEFFKQSLGGVTFSGGEPLLQSFSLNFLMKQLVNVGVNCAIETAGNVQWGAFEKILCYTDLFLYDLKAYNSDLHKIGTGYNNLTILDNFDRLYKTGANIIVRIPIIPSFNDNVICMSDIANMLTKYPNIKYVEFMPFHNIGQHKYESLSVPYFYENISSPVMEEIETIREIFINKGINLK